MSNFSTPLATSQEFRAPVLRKSDVTTINILHGFAYLMGGLCILALLFLGWSLFKIYRSPEWTFDPAKLSQVQSELIGLQTSSTRYTSNIKVVNSRVPAALPYYVASSTLPTGIQLKSVDCSIDSESDSGTGKLLVAKVTIQGTGPEGSGSALESYAAKINAMDPAQLNGFTPKASLTQSSVVKAADPTAPSSLNFSINLTLSNTLP